MAAAQPYVQTLDVNGQELVYRERGAPTAPVLVYWPGLNPFNALELIEAAAPAMTCSPTRRRRRSSSSAHG